MDLEKNSDANDLPETVLEFILSKVPEQEILQWDAVCRALENLTTRKKLWGKCFEKKKQCLDVIPTHILEKPQGWMILDAHLRHNILTKNYIENPSGHSNFSGWTILENGGDGWTVEPQPIGCDPVPETSFFGRNDSCCFVTSFGSCSKLCKVDLLNEGLTPALMKIMLPFQIKCSQMYSGRFDCGSWFDWELRLLNSKEMIIAKYKAPSISVSSSTKWETVQYHFRLRSNDVGLLEDLRYVVFIHEGKDNKCWAGHYGTKLARSSVTVECLEGEPAEESCGAIGEIQGEPEKESFVAIEAHELEPTEEPYIELPTEYEFKGAVPSVLRRDVHPSGPILKIFGPPDGYSEEELCRFACYELPNNYDNEDVSDDNDSISDDTKQATVDNKDVIVDNEYVSIEKKFISVDEERNVDNKYVNVDCKYVIVNNEYPSVANENLNYDKENVSDDDEDERMKML